MKIYSSFSIITLFSLSVVLSSCASIFPLIKESAEESEQTTVSEPDSTEDPFRLAVNRAMAASEAAQSARSIDEWNNVSSLWREAVESMRAVPESHGDYTLAQEKASEYSANLEYSEERTQVFLNANTQINGQKIIVSGETNLPDGFVVSVSGSRYHLEPDGPHVMSTVHEDSDVKATVIEGRFQAEITVPTVQQVRQGLIDFGKLMQDPNLENSPINEHVDISIVGTPMAQDDSILQLIGGRDGLLLVGPTTEDSSAGFRVAKLNLQVKI